jgi:hypothetical protein
MEKALTLERELAEKKESTRLEAEGMSNLTTSTQLASLSTT